jgi:hypothetical protein
MRLIGAGATTGPASKGPATTRPASTAYAREATLRRADANRGSRDSGSVVAIAHVNVDLSWANITPAIGRLVNQSRHRRPTGAGDDERRATTNGRRRRRATSDERRATPCGGPRIRSPWARPHQVTVGRPHQVTVGRTASGDRERCRISDRGRGASGGRWRGAPVGGDGRRRGNQRPCARPRFAGRVFRPPAFHQSGPRPRASISRPSLDTYPGTTRRSVQKSGGIGRPANVDAGSTGVKA